MRRAVAAGLVWLAVAGCSAAGSYEDYTRGMNAVYAGQYRTAIDAFSAALSAGDLAASYVPVAYRDRAGAYMSLGKCREALADADAAVKLKPADARMLMLHATAAVCMGQRETADRDFAAALPLRPGHSDLMHKAYGLMLWQNGYFDAAAGHFMQALTLADKPDMSDSYIALWYAMSAIRVHGFDAAAFAAAAKKNSSSRWPGPLLHFYQGQETEAQIYRDAEDRDAVTAIRQKCEADFYIGEWHLIHEDAAAAAPSIRSAGKECPKEFIEREMAENELRHLPGVDATQKP